MNPSPLPYLLSQIRIKPLLMPSTPRVCPSCGTRFERAAFEANETCGRCRLSDDDQHQPQCSLCGVVYPKLKTNKCGNCQDPAGMYFSSQFRTARLISKLPLLLLNEETLQTNALLAAVESSLDNRPNPRASSSSDGAVVNSSTGFSRSGKFMAVGYLKILPVFLLNTS